MSKGPNRPTSDPGDLEVKEPPVEDAEPKQDEELDLSNLGLDDVASGDVNAFRKASTDPFAGYKNKKPVKIITVDGHGKKHTVEVSPTFLVVYKGKLPSDPAMQGRLVHHHAALKSRFTQKIEMVSFDRSVGKVKDRVAIVPDSSLRAQLIWARDENDKLVSRDEYGVIDNDQIKLLGAEFVISRPGESGLVKRIMEDK
jgi:hypothetical protein